MSKKKLKKRIKFLAKKVEIVSGELHALQTKVGMLESGGVASFRLQNFLLMKGLGHEPT